MAPLVSVIIPTFNRADDLDRCLSSLQKQNFLNFEVLVCDDGSTDDTHAVIKKYHRYLQIRYFWSENWGGPARPRNIGLENALGQYIAFLDSDDWWHEDKLKVSLKCFEKGADLVYHDMLIVHKRGQDKIVKGKTHSRKLKINVFNDLAMRGNCIVNSSVVVKTAVIKEIGGFSENRSLIAAEDYFAWLEIARLGKKFCLIEAVLGSYWVGENNISSPCKAIMNTSALHNIYNDPTASFNSGNSIAFFQYSAGKANLRLNRIKRARSCFRLVVSKGVFFSTRLYALFYFVLCSIRLFSTIKR